MSAPAPLLIVRRAAAALVGGLVGPVPRFELIRASRHGRVHVVRVVTILVLLLFLWPAYKPLKRWEAPVVIDPIVLEDWRWRMTKFGELFVFALLGVQFAAVLILTPLWLGGAIAEEKDRKRLEFLLTTGLGDTEIVLGKLTAGIARLLLPVLAGLPLAAIVQLWTGIDPNLLVTGYAAIGLTIVSVAALTVLVSVHARKTRDAVIATYLTMTAFLIVSVLCHLILRPTVQGPAWPTWLADGNVLVTSYKVCGRWKPGKPLDDVVPDWLLHYGVYHGVLALTCVTLAVLRFRRAAWPRPDGAGWLGRLRLPWITSTCMPMVWKEIGVERRFRLGRSGWACIALIVVTTLIPVIFHVHYPRGASGGMQWYECFAPRAEVGPAFEVWGRLMVAGVACLALFGVAIHAAGSISGERERQVLDSLRTTPLTCGEVLFAKWLGSIVSVRSSALVVVAIWLVTVGVDGWRWLALAATFVVWLVFAGYFAIAGLWFSGSGASTERAALWTLAAVTLLALPWVFVQSHDNWAPRFAAPAPATYWLALHGDELSSLTECRRDADHRYVRRGDLALERVALGRREEPVAVLPGIVVGLAFWLFLTGLTWLLALRRLRRIWVEPEAATQTSFLPDRVDWWR